MLGAAFTTDLAGFDAARDDFATAMGAVPPEALSYLKPGDDYSTGGLVVHVNYVLAHYHEVLATIARGQFAECRPEDPHGLEEEANERSRSELSADEVGAELAGMGRLHRQVVAAATSLGAAWDRPAPVIYPGSSEPFPTSPADVLSWLTGHYREHVPHVQELVAAWRAQTDRPVPSP